MSEGSSTNQIDIYAVVDPGNAERRVIQAFSDREMASKAIELYGLSEAIISKAELVHESTDPEAGIAQRAPLQLYFLHSPDDPGNLTKAFTDTETYKTALGESGQDAWLEGVLDGLRRSVETQRRLFRVHMHVDGSVGHVAEGFEIAAISFLQERVAINRDDRRPEANVGSNTEAGVYYIYVYAIDKEQAIQLAMPMLLARAGRR